MKRFGKGQMVWIKAESQRSPWGDRRPDRTQPARYDKPGLERGTHMVRLNNGRCLTVLTSDIITKNEHNLQEAEKLLKS